MNDHISELMKHLGLEPLPDEGGFFVRSYRSRESIDARQFNKVYDGDRPLATAIYYLLTPSTFSAIHKLSGDEVFHFYLGDPVEMLELFPDGSGRTVILGHDILNGMKCQHVVSGGVWQGSKLVPGGKYALLGTTMSPGFDRRDFKKGNRSELLAQYPAHATLISQLL